MTLQVARPFVPRQDRALFQYHLALIAGNTTSLRARHDALVEYLYDRKSDDPNWELYPVARDEFIQVDDPAASQKLRYVSLSLRERVAEKFLDVATQQFEAPKAQNARRMSEYVRFAILVKETENQLERKR